MPAEEVERLAERPVRHEAGSTLSARNRFPGVVRSVESDGVMALVEIEAGPHRVTAAVTRDAVEELGLAEGVPGGGHGQGDVGDGGAGVRRLAALALVAARRARAAAASDEGGQSEQAGPQGLGRRLADRGLRRALKKDYTAADLRFSFAGSDELAAQIRKGVKPDVFAAANTKLPDALAKENLVDKPVVFATNELVLAVPAEGAKVSSLDDLEKPGIKIAVGSESVPVGEYTRKVLSGLPAEQQKAIEANFRSEEPDVKGVVGKISQGAVDAGFVYRSDVDAASGKLKAIALPDELEARRWPTARPW